MSSLDDDALSKMNKIGIIFYFKSQKELYERLLEGKDRVLESKDRLLESKDRLLDSKDFSTAQMVESSTLKLSIANGKYLKLKGNLNIRGLVEEFEQSDLFKECRKRLSVKFNVTDEASEKTVVELRAPSRKALWDEAMKDKEFSGLLACIAKSNPERRDTIGERIRDLYFSVSKDVHKHGQDDVISIQRNKLFDHEVNLAICLCKHFKVLYEVEDVFVAEDPDKLPEIVEEQ
eukprot:gene35517-46040_t